MSIRALTRLVFLAAIALAAAPAVSAPAEVRSIEAEGTQFKVTLDDGRVLRSPELVGAILMTVFQGRERRLRIDAVETDPGNAGQSIKASPDVYLHILSMQSPDGSWANICEAGPDGRRQAFPIPGRARDDATIWPAQPGDFELTCTGGAQGKCVRFGYGPWRNVPGGIAPYDLYNACVRMVRADYSGDGKGTTRNGMLIDLYDVVGIEGDKGLSDMEFEAGWTKDGAVCVRHVRVKENISLDALKNVESLKGLTGAVCTEEFARAHGALMFNRSRP